MTLSELARQAAETIIDEYNMPGRDVAGIAEFIEPALETAAGESNKSHIEEMNLIVEAHAKTQSKLTDLRAQIEASKQLQDETEISLMVLRVDYDRIKAELEQARKDGERLDWIRNHLPSIHSDHTGHVFLKWDGGVTGYYATLRMAIDAAIHTYKDTARQVGGEK